MLFLFLENHIECFPDITYHDDNNVTFIINLIKIGTSSFHLYRDQDFTMLTAMEKGCPTTYTLWVPAQFMPMVFWTVGIDMTCL